MDRTIKQQQIARINRLSGGIDSILLGLTELRDDYIDGEAGRKVALSVTNIEQGLLWLRSAALLLVKELEQDREYTRKN